MQAKTLAAAAALVLSSSATWAQAQSPGACPVTHAQLADALQRSVKPAGGPSNGGLDNHMWAAVVSRDGTVCAVAFSGKDAGDQWPGSRAIAVEKAFTVNGFSTNGMAMSTADLYSGAQPGGYLFGVQAGNPVDPQAIAAGDVAQYGTEQDPLVGKRAGGTIVFGGGLALYGANFIVGGLGLSGDTSCADHNVAWRVRSALKLDAVPKGPAPTLKDGIIYDIGLTGSSSGYGHPKCADKEADVAADIGAGGSSLK